MTHGSEKRARSAHITIRLTPEERAKVDADADRSGFTPGSYARGLILRAQPPRQVRRPPVEKTLLAEVLGHLGRVGSNVNQISRVLNGGGEADLPSLEHALADISEMRIAILKALGRLP